MGSRADIKNIKNEINSIHSLFEIHHAKRLYENVIEELKAQEKNQKKQCNKHIKSFKATYWAAFFVFPIQWKKKHYHIKLIFSSLKQRKQHPNEKITSFILYCNFFRQLQYFKRF